MPSNIYDLLTGVKIDDATVSQLDEATGRTFVDKDAREFWQGILTLSHVIRAARTYPLGGPIPETGTVLITAVADASASVVTPTGTEVWRVQNLDPDNCNVALMDSVGNNTPLLLTQPAAGQIPLFTVPFYLSSTLSLVYTNASGGSQTPSIAYHKVSL